MAKTDVEKRLSLRLIFWGITGIGIVLFLLLSFLTVYLVSHYKQSIKTGSDSSPFIQKGDYYFTGHIDMTFQKIPVVKDKNSLRLLILGGSQALGDPYTVADKDIFIAIAEELGLPTRGGISYWSQKFLTPLFKDRKIELINMGVGSRGFEYILKLLEKSIDQVKPDYIILLAGNNERDFQHMTGVSFLFYEQYYSEVATIRKKLAIRYQNNLQKLKMLSRQKNAHLIVSTVPTNIKDWRPYVPPNNKAKISDLKRKIAQGVLEEEDLNDPQTKAIGHFFLGHHFLKKRKLDQSYSQFILAKEYDLVNLRCSEEINRLLRMTSEEEGVSFVDFEKYIRRYAGDGIPGSDIFFDYVHLKLKGYMYGAQLFGNKILEKEGRTERIHLSPGETEILEQKFWAGIPKRNFKYRNLFKWFRLKFLHFKDGLSDENYRETKKNFESL